MKSAETQLHATGIFQTTAMRSSALMSGSCGRGSKGSQKKTRKSMLCSVIFAPICTSPQWTAAQLIDGDIQFFFQHGAGGTGGRYFVLTQ